MSSVVCDGEAGVGEDAATGLGVVRATRCRGNRKRLVGIVAVPEPADETADFIVAEVRHVIGTLDDDIGRNVARVICGEVIETTAGTSVTDEEVSIRVSCRVDDLRLFHRNGGGEVAELLLESERQADAPS